MLNPTCHLLALLGAHHILHVSRIRVNFISLTEISISLTIFNTGRFLSRCDLYSYLRPASNAVNISNQPLILHLSQYSTQIPVLRSADTLLRQLDVGLSPQRSGFDLSRLRVGFVVHKVALGLTYHLVFQFYIVSAIPPMLQAHLLTCHERHQILAINGFFK